MERLVPGHLACLPPGSDIVAANKRDCQAIACIVESRPVILLAHKHDEPGRAAFLVAHEVGHLAAGDCTPGHPVVDEELAIFDDAEIEHRADQYATETLIGANLIPRLDDASFKEIASQAARAERETGADASMIISAWAAETLNYPKAAMAWKALYRDSGARRLISQYFNRQLNLALTTETDRLLLRCVYGKPERDEDIA